jgi:ribulose-phosphate 3-epimerase
MTRAWERVGGVVQPGNAAGDARRGFEFVDFVLIMSVNPGLGQKSSGLHWIRSAPAARKRERGLKFAIEIDGGVTLANVAEMVKAGVEWVVAGSAIFGAGDPAGAFVEMQHLAHAAGMVHV